MATANKSNEIRIIRLLDAPVAAVWDAWTDPKQVAQWWGPRGFTITTHHKDLRPGGSWVYTMHGPDGVNYENKTPYLEVEKHAKLVYDHGGNDDRPPLFRVTVLFSQVGDQTKMDMTMTLATPEAAEETRKIIKKFSGNSTWDRLAEYLEKESTGKEKFVINRSFNAPLGLMFDAWTDRKHLSQWLPPTGFQMEFLRCDIKPGGSSFYVMSGPGGMKMYGRADYLKIEKPDRILYTQQFCDENEKVTRHPMSPTWPQTMMTTVQLAAEGPDRTRVTITWEPYGTTTREELDTFIKARGGMTQGWTGSLDKLEAHVEKTSPTPSPAAEPRDFVISREFDAPVGLVFETWTNPRYFERWWGPRMMQNSVTAMDVRPGGTFRVVMRGPDGVEYPFKGVYGEIVKDRKLVWTGDLSDHPDSWHDALDPQRDKSQPKPPYHHVTSVNFEDLDGRTRVTVHMRFESPDVRDRFVNFGMSNGWSQSFDRLSELLAAK